MDLGLRDKVALVTGGSSGIGLATARMFLEEGARVAICARGEERLRTAQRQLEALGPVYAEVCDVTDATEVQRFVGGAMRELDGVDVLVNNAGRSRVAGFMETSDQAWREELDLKFFGIINPVRAAYPHMKARGGGRIVNMNAILARQPEAHLVATSAARAGILNLTHSLAIEFAPANILVNAINLGTIASDQWHRRYQEANPGVPEDEWLAGLARQRGIPLGRYGQPREVAAAVLFLCSVQASFITGASLDVGGGVSRYV